MNQLECPFCGARELHEFEFRKTRANVTSSEFAKVYLRIDNPDSSVEYWQHVHGCRMWLLIQRNPSTGAVLEIAALPGPGMGAKQ
jgi:heterotetrameric sarcosine oxidase delta subunit